MVTMKAFLDRLKQTRIEQAIADAEKRSSGQIRVVMYPKIADDPVPVAAAEFLRLGMQKTTHRNAVLILVAPRSNSFAIYGDRAVHEQCGENFWKEVAAAMTEHFKAEHFTEGIVHGIERAGAILAEHFPRSPSDRNELPDDVIDHGTIV
jgi:uncharacterized membrane protein